MKKIENRDIVCISGVDWDPYWTRKQQLMSRFPESNRIVYLEPPISVLSPFKDSALWSKYRTWREGLRRHPEYPRIYLYSPPPFIPFANQVAGLNPVNQWILAADLRPKLARLGFSHPLLITYLPNSVDLLGRLDEQLVVYDVVDDHTEFQGFNSEVVWAMEKRLLRRADVTFATSRALYDDRKEFAREIHLLGNAAEFDFFQKAMTEDLPQPPELEGLRPPIIGFVGRIKEWIDLALLGGVASRRADWTFLMIGPVESDANMAAVEGQYNIHFIGMRPRSTLPGYLRYFDVGINPFRRTRLSRAVNPLKLYEYLAAGLPVVSTPMPELEQFSDIIETGDDVESTIAAIERALDDTDEKLARRIEAARANSWQSRADEFMDIIARKLEEKGQE